MQPNKSLHQTKPFVTHLAFARSAPNSFAGETIVSRLTHWLLSRRTPRERKRSCETVAPEVELPHYRGPVS